MTSIIPSTSIFYIFPGSLDYADLPPLQGFGSLPFMVLCLLAMLFAFEVWVA